MKTTIYLIRHGEAEGNVFRRLHGQYNSVLLPRGYEQREYLRKRFENIQIDAVYSSDLTRTMLTAGAVQKYHDLPLNTDPRLREVYMGRWEGVSWGDAAYYEPEQYNYFSKNPDLAMSRQT